MTEGVPSELPLLGARYQLLERIGSGGMGAVFRAHDQRLARDVAVKVLRHVDDPHHRARLKAEARFAGALHHPSIVRVYDYGEQHDLGGTSPYVVMQLVDGRPLAGPLPAPEVARLLVHLGQALTLAHAAGIVHRDLKPSNILVTEEGPPVLVDFGVAYSDGAEPLTETGLVIGTPDYLSPEQAEGNRATTASDIYALGVVAHQCLTGVSPFRRDTPVATALAHLREEAPALPQTVPHELRDLVTSMLAREPGDRPTAAEVVASSNAYLRGLVPVLGPMPTAPPDLPPPPPPPPPPPARPARHRRRTAVLVGSVALLVVAMLSLALRDRGPAEAQADAASARSGRPLAAPSAVSPSTRQVAERETARPHPVSRADRHRPSRHHPHQPPAAKHAGAHAHAGPHGHHPPKKAPKKAPKKKPRGHHHR